MKVLFVADIVGEPGIEAANHLIPEIRREESIDIVVANGENADNGLGMTCAIVDTLLGCGVDVITTGNHIWQNPDIYPYLKDDKVPIIRPHNYPQSAPGTGLYLRDNIAYINLIGRDGMPEDVECPFVTAENLIKEHVPQDALIFVDFHALNPGEKKSLAYALSDKVQIVVGTHTHTQTADAQILQGKTAYISDLGMTGVLEGVQGGSPSFFIKYYTCCPKPPVELAEGTAFLQGAIVELDDSEKKALNIEPLSRER